MAHGTYFAWDNADRGETPCVRDDNLELSYAAFAARTEAVAEQLAGLGVGPGDVVATFLPNRAELLVVLMAAWRLRAIGMPVNPGFTDTEAEYQLSDSGAAVVVSSAPVGDRQARTFLPVDELATTASAEWMAPQPPTADDDALLIYTSGSTGRPKGVLLGHDNLQFFTRSAVDFFGHGPDAHALLILPLFHVNAICVSCLTPMVAGGQISITGHFSAGRFFDDVVRLRPTYFSAVPTIYALLVSQGRIPDGALDSLRFAVCGAAPISRELLAKTEEIFGIPIVEGYGLTEATCASACNPVDGPRKLGTVGPAMPGQQIRIVDPEGRDVPTGERGEVLIGGPAVMRGYLNRPDATAETLIDGWLHTGDVGILDDDGYLRLVDRIKDMIIRGGENIYPKEIENALAGHESVLECAVVGAPDPVLGEVPVAFVVTYPEAEVTEDGLAAFVEPLLTRVKRPTEITIVEALPRNPVGKIDKPGLRSRVG
ncbi:putative acid--CoA ligase [Gordonia hirsuta DSM 44140 = NBRC 16056]|uniref:Putative acid--CoA ligase n=1 Tax=Gordonia hirsuta DSM 44140 = NBRC 16056 TaxID=1121927 RepID=L7L974_9ACTN|nr:AMP-binding protein [Gordonia hirsuta]GAC57700.1 putative acid--CoA ligase [Gordonia hirsuta DSM 44140 = NBRC 16056]